MADPFAAARAQSPFEPSARATAVRDAKRDAKRPGRPGRNTFGAMVGRLHRYGPDYGEIHLAASRATITALEERAQRLGVSRAQLCHDVLTLWLFLTKDASLARLVRAEGGQGLAVHTPSPMDLVPGHGRAGLPVPPPPPHLAHPHEAPPDLSLLGRLPSYG